ncbi:helix-turn-helix transcriptional regulator [Flavihumibacter solisilvae]|uniref:DNA-binding protein n=1 Tax=Flavihumibacter solisilvae TaxID=1349421 RepID=A0A0C1ILC2_9BACT|nr:YafY family protein [Flavihumibacter solisilvae]KIC94995.1 DNA-binding protein [Flavihumibacter solisilvae]
MNRIDRLTAILIQLQSRRIVKAQEIADRFDISLRTVYRDVKALEESGIPVIGEAGMGYSIMDGYRLPPVMFTREEAMAFLTAEKLVEKLTDRNNSANYQSAMFKIRAVLRTSEKDFLETIDDHIEVLQARHVQAGNSDLNLHQTILRSIAEKKVVHIRYFSLYKQEQSERSIEPVGIFFLNNYWHLVAWCRLRQDYRDFRMDRIKSLTMTEEIFRQQHPSIRTYLKQWDKGCELTEVVMSVEKKYVGYLGDQKYYYGLLHEKEEGDRIIMTFMTNSLEGFCRWFVMIGDRAAIHKPAELKTRIKEFVSSIAATL